MKYNKLSGHGRIKVPLGQKSHERGVPKNGWRIECLCGWNEEPFRNKREAESAYTTHIQNSLPICNSCKEKKTVREMSKSCETICKKCSTKRAKQWSLDNPNEWERQRRKSHLKKKYGITIAEYDQIVLDQNNSCAICFGNLVDSRGFRPHVDHCHNTGIVRGVLCGDCNKALGGFKDDINRIKNAYNYLLKSKL
ncbi:recombination endonuclease VII [Flavobacterium chryseum]|uniref:endonuclease VII domain-containing protein n=1 Tax=Flavobacterium sp. P3160 TaxID=2512113 RepID=UPI00106178EC|nr:endonuclease VII domain-containing protein [Flavobacterium sp. P3160]TDO68843.1 recombination endonuclease VII [Flavobacterium sp. P3160]